jgi:cytidylate kinase
VTQTPIPVVSIDGPGASGKGTLARALAERLGWYCLDSGLAYRGLAWVLAHEHEGRTDEETVRRGLDNLRFEDVTKRWHLFLGSRDLTAELGGEELGELASRVAARPEVRARLLPLQRACLRRPGLVAEGRDMGTVVFPEARLKVFLIASPEIRAERRWRQLSASGVRVNLDALTEAIRTRDRRDCGRETAPLRPAEGAFVLDSTERTVGDLVTEVLDRLGGMGLPGGENERT